MESLARALKDADSLALGEPIFREPIQHFAFLAGWMAGADLPISAAVALCHGLREVTGDVGVFYDWLVVVVAEAYSAGVEQAAEARHRQIIEKSQVVCALAERVVALFVVGDPDREALDDAIGRLMMLAVMRDARAIIIDAAGLLDHERLFLATSFVAEHRQALARRQVMISGVSPELGGQLAEQSKLPLEHFECLDFALAAIVKGETAGSSPT